ncbi:MAG: hypothetical protein AAF497_28685, partial [Planctomycetota bacterium]
MQLSWQFVTGALAFWIASVAAVAVYVCRKHPQASRNPVEWLPFFLAAPFIVVMSIGIYVLLCALALLSLIWSITVFPFIFVPRIRSDGVAFTSLILGTKKLLPWADIAEWQVED